MNKIVLVASLAAFTLSANAATELVVNGDFETGTFAGWNKSGNASLSDVIANTTTSNHTFLWRSGATGTAAFISQNLATVPGGNYTLAFDVFSAGTSGTLGAVSFSAYFNGNLIFGFQNQTMSWTHYTFDNLAADTTLTELKFGARNDPSFVRLDNVSVIAVPEPETYALMLAGLCFLGLVINRRQTPKKGSA